MNTVFITGGASGIGAASVSKFLVSGWQVSFIDIDTERAHALVESLGNSPSLLFTEGSTRSRADIKRAAELTIARFGSINSVVANAGIHRRNTLLDITDEELDLMIDINIRGTINTLQVTVPYLVENGGGSIVINASDQCFIGKPHSFGYGLTKGALGQMTRSLSIDLGEKGIRVNAVCAGTVRTPLVDNLFQRFAKINACSPDSYWEEENALFARGRVGEASEVAELIYFLSSDIAGFCTGGLYPIDGGLTAK